MAVSRTGCQMPVETLATVKGPIASRVARFEEDLLTLERITRKLGLLSCLFRLLSMSQHVHVSPKFCEVKPPTPLCIIFIIAF